MDTFEFEQLDSLLISIKLLDHCLDSVDADDRYLKWAVISLVDILQGIFIRDLRGTMDINVYSDKDIEEWWLRREEGGEYPNTHLDKFITLYKRWAERGYTKEVNDDQKLELIENLRLLRNKFTHFPPEKHIWEKEEITQPLMDGIKFALLIMNTSWLINWMDEEDEMIVKASIENIEEKLSELFNSR